MGVCRNGWTALTRNRYATLKKRNPKPKIQARLKTKVSSVITIVDDTSQTAASVINATVPRKREVLFFESSSHSGRETLAGFILPPDRTARALPALLIPCLVNTLRNQSFFPV